MSSILRVSEAAALGLHASVYLAAHTVGWHSVGDIARELNVSENHLSKVCQRLVRADLLKSVRGPGGGIALAHSADQITLLAVYEAIEGPINTNYCLLGKVLCSGQSCVMGGLVESIHRQVEEYFAHTTLAALGSTDPLLVLESRRERPHHTSTLTTGGRNYGKERHC